MLLKSCSTQLASIQRTLVRHSSKAAKAQKRATEAKAQRRAEDQRSRTLALERAERSIQAQEAETVLLEPTRGGLNERVIYKYTGERLPDIRLVIGAGVTISCMVHWLLCY